MCDSREESDCDGERRAVGEEDQRAWEGGSLLSRNFEGVGCDRNKFDFSLICSTFLCTDLVWRF